MHNRLAMKLPRSRWRSEEHTSELQSQSNLVCRLLLEKMNSHLRLQSVLDLGSGEGSFLDSLQQRSCRTFRTHLNPQAANICRPKSHPIYARTLDYMAN